jgi:carboxylesterase
MSQNEYIKKPQLDGETFMLEGGNEVGILLFHGYTATTTEVRLLAECLHLSGYTISAPLLPGHGTHPDDLNHVKWQDWVSRGEIALEELKQRTKKVFVGGESMGALVALMITARHPEICGVMTFTPGMKVNNLWASPLVALFKKWLPKEKKEDGLAWKGYNVFPLKGAVQLLQMQKVTRKAIRQIKQPVLVVTGGLDKTITPDSADLVIDNIGSADITQVCMQYSTHCVLLDKEIDQVCQLTNEFISKLI